MSNSYYVDPLHPSASDDASNPGTSKDSPLKTCARLDPNHASAIFTKTNTTAHKVFLADRGRHTASSGTFDLSTGGLAYDYVLPIVNKVIYNSYSPTGAAVPGIALIDCELRARSIGTMLVAGTVTGTSSDSFNTNDVEDCSVSNIAVTRAHIGHIGDADGTQEFRRNSWTGCHANSCVAAAASSQGFSMGINPLAAGQGNSMSQCSASDNAVDGFIWSSANTEWTVSQCRSQGNGLPGYEKTNNRLGDGFACHIRNGVEFKKCLASGNAAKGFSNAGSGTIVVDECIADGNLSLGVGGQIGSADTFGLMIVRNSLIRVSDQIDDLAVGGAVMQSLTSQYAALVLEHCTFISTLTTTNSFLIGNDAGAKGEIITRNCGFKTAGSPYVLRKEVGDESKPRYDFDHNRYAEDGAALWVNDDDGTETKMNLSGWQTYLQTVLVVSRAGLDIFALSSDKSLNVGRKATGTVYSTTLSSQKITRSSGSFVDNGFTTGTVAVTGFGAALPDASYTISAVSDSELTLSSGITADQAAGPSVTMNQTGTDKLDQMGLETGQQSLAVTGFAAPFTIANVISVSSSKIVGDTALVDQDSVQATLAWNWVGAGDRNSIIAEPSFVDELDTDNLIRAYRLREDSAWRNAGVMLSTCPTDILGQTRGLSGNGKPDVGCMEYAPFSKKIVDDSAGMFFVLNG